MLERDYRAKTVEGKKWVYGLPMCNPISGTLLMAQFGEDDAFDFALVDPATLGQYTGRLDINANRIYEGDIVLVTYNPYNAALDRTEEKKFFGQVKYDDFHACFIVEDFDGDKYRAFEYQIIEVIGNIHDDKSSEA